MRHPDPDRDEPLRAFRQQYLRSLTACETIALRYKWEFWARPAQLEPEPDPHWNVWALVVGRGWGKCRTAVEWIRKMIESGRAHRVGVVAACREDAHYVLAEGVSGFLSVCPPWDRPAWDPFGLCLKWATGATVQMLPADMDPEQLLRYQFDLLWAREFCSWPDPDLLWPLLEKHHGRGKAIVTTTPKPLSVVRSLILQQNVHVTRGTTMDNGANFSPSFLSTILEKFEGTRLGLQELHGEILEDDE